MQKPKPLPASVDAMLAENLVPPGTPPAENAKQPSLEDQVIALFESENAGRDFHDAPDSIN